ncbi:hypothetical protein, partial [Cobetia crustatorum]|uniref:hypothetical protein n=1 Tax=Cobetia crustatorum TaxID=553385 RepID=UPI0005515605
MLTLCRKPILSFSSSLIRILDSKKDQRVKDVINDNQEVLKSQVTNYIFNRRRLEKVSSHGFNDYEKSKLSDCYEK